MTINLYEASIWPNNQSPILLGYFEGTSIEEVRKKAALDNNIPREDIWVEICGDKDTSVERWRNKV
jgi:hypothetical protein